MAGLVRSHFSADLSQTGKGWVGHLISLFWCLGEEPREESRNIKEDGTTTVQSMFPVEVLTGAGILANA